MFQKHLFLAEELTNFVLESLLFDVEQTFHVENSTSQAFKLPFTSLENDLFKPCPSTLQRLSQRHQCVVYNLIRIGDTD